MLTMLFLAECLCSAVAACIRRIRFHFLGSVFLLTSGPVLAEARFTFFTQPRRQIIFRFRELLWVKRFQGLLAWRLCLAVLLAACWTERTPRVRALGSSALSAHESAIFFLRGYVALNQKRRTAASSRRTECMQMSALPSNGLHHRHNACTRVLGWNQSDGGTFQLQNLPVLCLRRSARK